MSSVSDAYKGKVVSRSKINEDNGFESNQEDYSENDQDEEESADDYEESDVEEEKGEDDIEAAGKFLFKNILLNLLNCVTFRVRKIKQ